MKPLSDDSRAILSEQSRDAAPSLSEAAADWAGVPLDDVTEAIIMRYLDATRDEAEAEWSNLYPMNEPGGVCVPWARQEPLSDTIPF